MDILVTGRNTFKQALSFKEWDAMAGDFQKSLDKFKVPIAEQKDLFEVVGKTKVDIVTMK